MRIDEKSRTFVLPRKGFPEKIIDNPLLLYKIGFEFENQA